MFLFFRMSRPTAKFWLLKAEPDKRIVKGKDVKVGSMLPYDLAASRTSVDKIRRLQHTLNHILGHAILYHPGNSVQCG